MSEEHRSNWQSCQWPTCKQSEQQNKVVLDDTHIKIYISMSSYKYKLLDIMGNNRQISHAEGFQITCIDPLASRWWSITCHFLRQGCTLLPLPKKYSMDGSNFIVEKPSKSARWSRPISTVIHHVDRLYPCYDIIKRGYYLHGIPLKNP